MFVQNLNILRRTAIQFMNRSHTVQFEDQFADEVWIRRLCAMMHGGAVCVPTRARYGEAIHLHHSICTIYLSAPLNLHHLMQVPLMLEDGYRAKGWLGMLLGVRLWYGFFGATLESEGTFEEKRWTSYAAS